MLDGCDDIYDVYESLDEASLGFHLVAASNDPPPIGGPRPTVKVRKVSNGNQHTKARYQPLHRVRGKSKQQVVGDTSAASVIRSE